MDIFKTAGYDEAKYINKFTDIYAQSALVIWLLRYGIQKGQESFNKHKTYIFPEEDWYNPLHHGYNYGMQISQNGEPKTPEEKQSYNEGKAAYLSSPKYQEEKVKLDKQRAEYMLQNDRHKVSLKVPNGPLSQSNLEHYLIGVALFQEILSDSLGDLTDVGYYNYNDTKFDAEHYGTMDAQSAFLTKTQILQGLNWNNGIRNLVIPTPRYPDLYQYTNLGAFYKENVKKELLVQASNFAEPRFNLEIEHLYEQEHEERKHDNPGSSVPVILNLSTSSPASILNSVITSTPTPTSTTNFSSTSSTFGTSIPTPSSSSSSSGSSSSSRIDPLLTSSSSSSSSSNDFRTKRLAPSFISSDPHSLFDMPSLSSIPESSFVPSFTPSFMSPSLSSSSIPSSSSSIAFSSLTYLPKIENPLDFINIVMNQPLIETWSVTRYSKAASMFHSSQGIDIDLSVFIKWKNVNTKNNFSTIYFYPTQNGKYDQSINPSDQTKEPPNKGSQWYNIWMWIKNKPIFKDLGKCRNVNEFIWNMIGWCAFPGIQNAFEQRNNPNDTNFFAIFLIEVLDSFFDCVFSENQEIINFAPFVQEDIVSSLLETHPNGFLFEFSRKNRFHIHVTFGSRASFKTINLFENVTSLTNLFEACNNYKIDNAGNTNNFYKVTGKWPLTNELLKRSIDLGKSKLPEFQLGRFEQINFPILAPWPFPANDIPFLNSKQAEYHEQVLKMDIIIDGELEKLPQLKNVFLVPSYLFQLASEKVKSDYAVNAMFARKDFLAMYCFPLGEHDLDPLMINNYKNILKKHLAIFRAMPELFGGGKSTSQFANSNWNAEQSLVLFEHFLAFNIMFFLWLSHFGQVPNIDVFVSQKISELLKASQLEDEIVNKLSVNFEQKDKLFDRFVFYFNTILRMFNLPIVVTNPNLEQIYRYFISSNTFDFVQLMYFSPLFTQFRESLNVVGEFQVSWNIVSPIVMLQNEFKSQFDFDQFDNRYFDIVFNNIMMSLAMESGGVSLGDIFKEYLFSVNFNYIDYVNRLDLEGNLKSIYLRNAEISFVCGDLFPMITRYGEFGCTMDEDWMNKPMEMNNTWLWHLVKNIQKNIMENGFWYCENNELVNNARAIHILRWLGYPFMQQASESYSEEKSTRWKKLNQKTKNVIMMIWFLNRSPSAFPFITNEDAKTMIEYTGNNNAGMCRISSSRPLEIVIQTNTNPIYIPFDQWNEAMNTARSNMELPRLSNLKIDYLALVQYTLRMLAAKSNIYLVRNLEFIRQMAIQCNKRVFWTDTTWEVSEAFGFKSIHEELKFVTDKLIHKSDWKNIIPFTTEASENIRDVNNALSTNCVAPRAIDYGKGTRSGRVGSNEDFITSHIGAKFLFGEFSGNNECIDTKLSENRYWMITKQPFMALDEMERLLIQYKSSDYPIGYLQLVIKVWPILDDIIGEKWCHRNDQYQGNRNKTLLVNWLGPKTLHYLLVKDYLRKPIDKLSIDDWKTVYGLYWMMRCDFFYGFLNPYEQEVYAYTHLKQAVVSLDLTLPHHYNCFVVKNYNSITDTNQIQHEIANNVSKHKQFNVSDIFGKLQDNTILPFPILALQYIITTFTNPMIDQKPITDNAMSCGESFVPKPFDLDLKVHINDAVSSELAIELIRLLANHKVLGSKQIIDFQWLKDFTNKKEEPKTYITLQELKNQVDKMVVDDTFKLYSTGSILESFNPFHVERNTKKNLTLIQEFLSEKDIVSLGTKITDEKLLEKYNAWKSPKAKNGAKLEFEYALEKVAEEIHSKRPGFQVAEGRPNQLKSEERKSERKLENTTISDFFNFNIYPNMRQVGFIEASQLRFLLQGLLNHNIIPAIKSLYESQQSIPLDNRSMSICEALLKKSNDMEVLAFPPIGFSENLNALKTTKYQQLHVGWELKEKSLLRTIHKFKNLFQSRKTSKPGIQQRIQEPSIPQIPQGPLRPTPQVQLEYFSDTRDKWSEGSEAMQAQVEKNVESPGQCGDRLYPAFTLTNGLLIPRCGKENWISQAEIPSEQQLAEMKDKYARELLIFIQDTTRATWCIQTYQKVRLWRWIGIKCFSNKSLNRLKREALIKQSQDTSNYLLEFANVSNDNKQELLEELRIPEDVKESICEGRIQFLAQTINTNLLFPFVVNEQEALILSGKHLNQVVVMLDWSRSGRVNCYLTPSDGSPIIFRDFQAEDIVSEHLFATTSLRLKVFEQFAGGIIADNESYHASKCQMLGTSAKNLRFLSIRDMLPRFYQEQFDNLVRQPITPETKLKAKQLKDMSIVAQSKNLTTAQIDLLKQIIALEDAASKSQNFVPTAQLLYSQQIAQNTREDVRQFQVLSLCSRPEFIGYLRDKYHQLNPTISMGEIERLPRSYLCQALLGAKNVRNIIIPIKVWDIKNVPNNLQDAYGFINLNNSDPNFQIQVESFLVKNYGVTLQEMREYNKDIPKETLQKYADLLKQNKEIVVHTASDIRTALRSKCANNLNESECSKIKVNSVQLCRWNNQICEASHSSALNFLEFVIEAFCQPNLGLTSNEVGFIDLVFRTLSNFFVFINQRKPTTDSLDAKCNYNTAMMTELKRLAAIQSKNWQMSSIEQILQDQKAEALNVKFKLFQSGKPVPKHDLRQIWAEAQGLSEEDAILLTILLLIYCGLITKVFIIP